MNVFTLAFFQAHFPIRCFTLWRLGVFFRLVFSPFDWFCLFYFIYFIDMWFYLVCLKLTCKAL